MERDCFVYIMTNRLRGTLYVGVTNNLIRRVWEHRMGLALGFTQKYRLRRLVHYEHFSDFSNAIEREKRLKRWRREWKLALIEKANPRWRDLYPQIAHSESVNTDVPY